MTTTIAKIAKNYVFSGIKTYAWRPLSLTEQSDFQARRF